MSPEEWLAQQGKTQPAQQPTTVLSPEEWLAKQKSGNVELYNPNKPAEPTPEQQSMFRQYADIPLQSTKGLVSGVRMIADAFGSGSETSNTLRGAEDYLAKLMSAQSKQDSKEITRIMKEAEDKGVLDQVQAGIKAFSVAPVDMLSNALGTAAPAIIGGLVASTVGAPAAVVTGAGIGIGALMGAGTVKGTIYDAVKEELSKTDMPKDQIEARAQLAQDYNGKNLDMILAGTALGGLASSTGIEKSIVKQVAGKIIKDTAKKEVAKEVVEAAAKKKLEEEAARGVIKQGTIGATKEAVPEFLQAGQEQLSENIALQREGYNVPTMRGVVGAGTLEGIAGAGLGAPVSIMERNKIRRELAEEKLAAEEGKTEEEKVTETKATARDKIREEEVSKLAPVLDETGKPIVEAAPIEQQVERAIDPKVKEAQDELDAVESGAKKSIHPQRLDKLLRNLEVAVPEGTDRQGKVELLKQRVAELGEANARGIDSGAGGAGATISKPGVGVGGAGEVTTADTTGVGGAGAIEETARGRTTTEQRTLTPNKDAYAAARKGDTAAGFPIMLNGTTYGETTTVPYELVKQAEQQILINHGNQSLKTLAERGGLTPTELLAALEGKEFGALKDMSDKQASQILAKRIGQRTLSLKTNQLLAMAKTDAAGVINRANQELDAGNITPEEHTEIVNAAQATIAEQERLAVSAKAAAEKRLADEQAVEEQQRAAFETDIAEQEAAAAQRQADLEEVAGKTIPRTKVSPEFREDYDRTRQEMADEGVDIPAWDKLTAAEKDIYTGSIKYESPNEHRAAAQKLADIREGYPDEKLTPAQRRVANGYDENRKTYERGLNINLPAWGDLSPTAKGAYFNQVKNNTAIEQNEGFNAVADILEQEGTALRGVTRSGIEQLKLRGTEEEAKTKAQAETEQRRAKESEAAGKGKAVADQVRESLEAGDVNGALQALVDTAKGLKIGPQKGETGRVKELAKRQSILSKIVNKFLALALSEIHFDSKVVTDPNNEIIQRLEREGKLAEYDPKTDTFYFTKNGFDESTVLHEIVHAATVKLINKYLTDPDSLLPYQREALDHLSKIFDFAKKRLGGKYKNAFENLYEFVGYALTDTKFQAELANTQVRPLAKYSVKDVKTLWDNLTQAFAKLFNLTKATPTRTEVRPELFDAFAKGLAPIEKETLFELTEEGDVVTTVGDIIPGMEPKIQEKKEKFKPGKMFLGVEPGYEGNLLVEISEIFSDILESPEAGIEVEPLAAKKAGAAPKKTKAQIKAEELEAGLRDTDLFEDSEQDALSPEEKPKTLKWLKDRLFTRQGWRDITTTFQNHSYQSRHHENQLSMADKLVYDVDPKKMNNIWTQLTQAAGRGKVLFDSQVKSLGDDLNFAIGDLAKSLDIDTEKTLVVINRLREALHEGERRQVKFWKTVPLSTKPVLKTSTGTISPADYRKQLIDLYESNTKFTDAQIKQIRDSLILLSTKYVDNSDPKGTPTGRKDMPTNIDDVAYNVLGVKQSAIKDRLAQYNESKYKDKFDKVMDILNDMNKVTQDLNTRANYWTQSVTNISRIYDYKYYSPFKGKADKFKTASETDRSLDYGNDKKTGKALQELEHQFMGRLSPSHNVVLQTMSEAVRAAQRAGMVNEDGYGLTQAVKNSLAKNKLNPDGQGLIHGKVIQHIPFNERSEEVLRSIPREKTLFHHNADGSIDVLQIDDQRMLDSIRRTYKDINPLWDVANKVTSFFGQLHTRYNYNFAPLNFVRDAFTNAFTLGAEMGPAKAAKFLTQLATKVTTENGLGKAAKMAFLYEQGKFGEIKRLGKVDPYYRDMWDFINEGGMTSYLDGITLKSNFQRFRKEIGRSGIVRTKEQFDKFIDIYNNMFELASRTAAFGIVKQEEIQKNLAKGMTKAEAEKAAITKAAEYTKNLANFELVGNRGREMGALFMFFRPSATGAVRAIEALLPAFQNSKKIIGSLPPHIANDPKAKAAFVKNFKEKQKNARVMIGSLIGMGMALYTMAAMMAPEDDEGRNQVIHDNMDQWTRFARFHFPGMDTPIQLPWGFGLGAFASSGAQLASAIAGGQTFGRALINIATQIALDSFVPLPISRMSALESPIGFFVDSVLPSTFRPLVEFAMNKNGLGQDIYPAAGKRKMGEAYMGGDKIPEIYKEVSKGMFNKTGGYINVSPNSLYFFANSYADGIVKLTAELPYSIYDLVSGRKEFSAKTDLPLFGSFFGAKTSVDTREWMSVQKQMEEKIKIVNTMKKANVPEDVKLKYEEKHPFDEELIRVYQQDVGKKLNRLNEEANKIRLEDYTPKERAELLRLNKFEQDLIKHDLIEKYKAYDIKP